MAQDLLNDTYKLKPTPLKHKNWQLNNYTNFGYIFADYVLVATAITLSYLLNNPICYILAIIIIGSRMRALENLLHEASHRKLFKNRLLNDYGALFLCALPVVNSLFAYRTAHNKHHRYLNNPKLDPDRMRFEQLNIEKSLENSLLFVKKMLRILFFLDTVTFIKGTIKHFIFNKESPLKEIIIRISFYLVVFSFFTYFSVWPFFLHYWVVPYFSVFQLIRFLAEVSEHGNLYQNADIYQSSRNNLCHPVIAFILYPHVDHLHLLHHLYPAIPHYASHSVHNDLMEKDQCYQNGMHCHGYFVQSRKDHNTTFFDLTSSFRAKAAWTQQ